MKTEHEILGYKIYIELDTTIGEPQQSIIDYIRTQLCQGNGYGQLIEGRWYTSDCKDMYKIE